MASREQAVPPATTLAFDKTTTGIDEPIKRGVAPGEREGAQVAIKPWSETAPEIQSLCNQVFQVYTEKDQRRLETVLKRFEFNAVFETPVFFARGVERIKVLNQLTYVVLWRMEIVPKVVKVRMLPNNMGEIEVSGIVRYFPRWPRFWPLSMVLPESIDVHASWDIVAQGQTDKVQRVRETYHNWPKLPRSVRALYTTALTTYAATITTVLSDLGLNYFNW